MSAPHDNAVAHACLTCNGMPTWCPAHGDLWYDDDGDVHFSLPPAEVVAERKAYPADATGSRPLDWEFPMFGLTISYVDDDGRLVTNGFR